MARIEVPMPQMGESIAEGTVSKWLKSVGEAVERDEPILEISTDKVDAEIPSPSQGTLVEILVGEGQTVEVGTVVAYVDTEAAPDASASSPPQAAAAPAATEEQGQAPVPSEEQEQAPAPSVEQGQAPAPAGGEQGEVPASEEERLRSRSTPVVRRIAQEQGVDLSRVQGTGFAGRVTKQDILGYLESRKEAGGGPVPSPAPKAAPEAETAAAVSGLEIPSPAPSKEIPEATPAGERHPAAPRPVAAETPILQEPPSDFWNTFYSQVQHPEFPVRPLDRVEAMDKIRRLTAEHMVLAKRIAPHVHSFIEIDFTEIDRIRRSNKARWAEQGVNVSFTAFVVWACSRLLREYPKVNGTISGNNVIFRGNVNVGVAVDLDPGLIVPVIRDADELSLVGIAKRIVDLAGRARNRKLNPEEIQGATFSITNPGVLGTLVGMPIIPKGTSAILGTGVIEKRVVVVEDPLTGTDALSIRKRSLFSLGYDHRIVDGADAARFLARLKDLMESFPEDA